MDIQMSYRQIRVLTILVLSNISTGTTISIFAPFYPKEAESKGMSATEYGIIFSVFQIVPFVLSPVFGKYLYKLGSTRIFNIGSFSEAIVCMLFGTLDSCENRRWFVPLSFTFAMMKGIGAAGHGTAAFAMISIEFPHSMARTFAVFQTAFGIGLFIGPPIGGLFFEIGGFPLPFFVLGGFLLFISVLSLLTTPEPIKKVLPEKSDSSDEFLPEKPTGMLKLLKIPGVFLAAITAMSSGMIINFIATILEPHVRQFNLRPIGVTGFFVALTGTYAVSAPAWGWVCDKTHLSNYITLAGAIIMLIGCVLIGPAPFLPFDTILWVTLMACFLQGLGIGALNVSSFLQMSEWSKKYGFPDDVTTYGLTSGLWFSFLCFGYLIGPIAAGVLYDHVGFRVGSVFCILEILVLVFLEFVFICWILKKQLFNENLVSRASSKAQDSESLPLINQRKSIY